MKAYICMNKAKYYLHIVEKASEILNTAVIQFIQTPTLFLWL